MAEQTHNSKGIPGWIWAVLIGGIVLSLIIGCAVGAVGGFFAGRLAMRGGAWSRTLDFNLPEITLPQPETPKIEPQVPRADRLPRVSGAALIREVQPDSPAEKAGLKAGDIITHVDGVRLTTEMSLADVIAKHKPGDEVTLTLGNRIANRQRNVKVTLGASPTDSQKAYLGVTYMQMEFPDLSDLRGRDNVD